MDWLGLVLVGALYTAVLILGLCASRRTNKGCSQSEQEQEGEQDSLLLAGRDLGVVAGIVTLVATEVGGGFINGTSEEVFKPGGGLLWCLAPIGYSLSMALNGFTFAPKLRSKGCVTLVDILQRAYGPTLGAAVYLPSCVGDVCWTACVLTALSTSLEALLGVDRVLSAAASAAVAAAYTVTGGMRAVAATDVAQLALITIGMWTAVPFILTSPDVQVSSASLVDWTGVISKYNAVQYVDTLLLVLLGGLPWQPYYQRALSLRNPSQVSSLSTTSAGLSLLFVIPPAIIGVAAKTSPVLTQQLLSDPSSVLPVTVKEEAPYLVSLLCLAGISAAVMSSVDSSLLSGASYLTHNLLLRGSRSHFRAWLFRVIVVLLAVVATIMSVHTDTVYGLWQLAGDLGYVVVFPQFLAATFLEDRVNSMGSLAGLMVGSCLRLSLGEPLFSLPALVLTPKYSDGSEIMPVKTMVMCASLATLLAVSRLARRKGHERMPQQQQQEQGESAKQEQYSLSDS